MFQLNLLQIFGPRNDILSRPLLVLKSRILNVICDLVLYLFREDTDMLFRYDGAIPFQHLKRIVEAHSYIICPTPV